MVIIRPGTPGGFFMDGSMTKERFLAELHLLAGELHPLARDLEVAAACSAAARAIFTRNFEEKPVTVPDRRRREYEEDDSA